MNGRQLFEERSLTGLYCVLSGNDLDDWFLKLVKAIRLPTLSPRNPRSLELIHVSLTQVVSPVSVPATVEGYRITEKILLISR